MKIEIGRYYENRTRDYLLPCLNAHGNDFVGRYETIFKLAVGIHDSLLDRTSEGDSKNMYILCDSKAYPKNFQRFLVWVRSEEYYVADYTIDSEVKTSRRYMIVLLMPSKYHNAYDKFREGKYSEMYTKEEVEKLFSSNTKKTVKKILLQNPSMRAVHCSRVDTKFGTASKPDDYIGCELDFPLTVDPQTEIFNYYLNNKKI